MQYSSHDSNNQTQIRTHRKFHLRKRWKGGKSYDINRGLHVIYLSPYLRAALLKLAKCKTTLFIHLLLISSKPGHAVQILQYHSRQSEKTRNISSASLEDIKVSEGKGYEGYQLIAQSTGYFFQEELQVGLACCGRSLQNGYGLLPGNEFLDLSASWDLSFLMIRMDFLP